MFPGFLLAVGQSSRRASFNVPSVATFDPSMSLDPDDAICFYSRCETLPAQKSSGRIDCCQSRGLHFRYLPVPVDRRNRVPNLNKIDLSLHIRQ